MTNVNKSGERVATQIRRENSFPSTPTFLKSRPLPGPSPLSLKRSSSYSNIPFASDRSRKRRLRSPDIVFKKRVSTLLEQAQFMYKSGNESISPPSRNDGEYTTNEVEFAFDGDLDLLEAELQFDPAFSDELQKVEVGKSEIDEFKTMSDDLFDNDFDDLNPEELEALDLSSNNSTLMVHQDGPKTGPQDDMLFGDGYDELMDLDLDETHLEV